MAEAVSSVRVNCVSSGVIDSPIRAGMSEVARVEMVGWIVASLPVGRVGVANDI
ncbi:MAG: hypothetical protein Q8M24_23850 [Pseudolabrys sp.]|nr:hypothetical protein [Pseudolabrys sp.]MDP2298486.1 hypothetical protein [Pseudolabrys sp.]